MAAVHPEYDVQTRTWFIPGLPAAEAPTVRELLVKLRLLPNCSRDRVADYYPQGYSAPAWPKGDPGASSLRPDIPAAKFTRYGTGVKSVSSVTSPAAPAQTEEAPQPPAKSRVQRVPCASRSAAAGPVKRYDHDRVLAMWAQGIAGPDIASALGMRPVVPGQIVAAARKRGDPRALPRAPKSWRRR